MANASSRVTPMRFVRAAAGVALTLALGAGGCGGGTHTVTQGGPPTTPVPAAATTAGTTATATATAPDKAPTKVVRLATFQSPTGNIGCAIAGGMARCDIVQ